MSHKATSWVLDHSEATGNDRLVLLSIADHADPEGANAWPKLDTIAQQARVSRRTVHASIARLVALGELTVEVKAGGNGHTEDRYRPNRYTLPGVQKLHPSSGPRGADCTAPGVQNRPVRGADRLHLNVLKERPLENVSQNGSAVQGDEPLFDLSEDPFWKAHPKTLDRLRRGDVPEVLLDPAYLRGVEVLTEHTGVMWDDQLIRYQAWWANQPPSGRRRHRRKQFDNWLARAIAKDRWDRQREAERADARASRR